MVVVHVVPTEHVDGIVVDRHGKAAVQYLGLLCDDFGACPHRRPSVVYRVVHFYILINIVEFVEASEPEYVARVQN